MTERRDSEREPIPYRIDPMVPSETKREPTGLRDWIAETKWNGIRGLAYIRGRDNITIRSKTWSDLTSAFPDLVRVLSLLGNTPAILDGEIVAGLGKGPDDLAKVLRRARFSGGNAQRAAREDPCQYVIFDLVFVDRKNLTLMGLTERKKELRRLIRRTLQVGDARVYVNDYAWRDHPTFIDALSYDGHEGVVFKRKVSTYRSGTSRSWLKMKF